VNERHDGTRPLGRKPRDLPGLSGRQVLSFRPSFVSTESTFAVRLPDRPFRQSHFIVIATRLLCPARVSKHCLTTAITSSHSPSMQVPSGPSL
jgi:hypothetical protein